MTRKQAREEAFILVFEKGFNDDSLADILSLAKEVRDIETDDYINRVFFGVFENIEKIDGIISKNAVGWSINRISKTALAILRLAIYEIEFFDEIPISVSINEAVELAKKYATKEDASFINGILSTVAKAQNNAD
ncbi:MAG: transcription antitermination factor NusB [Clostridia bacterium]|nr:transcription antitermination factor NusB [Clostridia bacterium]